ncbi:MAG TPA: nuclear transport factor 2 family protein [Acidimicrobiales bacterium]|nr:nuclear transport factor 2 family protein [Acidimicrobiales bacterium]
MSVVQRYLRAVGNQDWETAEACLGEDVVRLGPFGDDFQGRADYIGHLRQVMPALQGYRMEIGRLVVSPDRKTVVAELAETVDLAGVPTRTEESLVFDLDGDGLISRIAIYIRQSAPRPGS